VAQQYPSSSIRVIGIKETLRTLNKLAPEIRRAYTKEYKKIVKPVVDQAKFNIPSAAPLSGMERGFKRLGKWDSSLVKKGIVPKIDTRKARNRNAVKGVQYENVGTFYVISKTGYGMLFDMAGKKSPDSPMVVALQSFYGAPSRTMWPAWENHKTEVEGSVVDLVKRIEKSLSNELDK
jgi:hypothetical protein